MKNKLILYALNFFLLFNICAYAQDITPGYYRVRNVGLATYGGTILKKTGVKEDCYAYVSNGTYHVKTSGGYAQDIPSMLLWAGLDEAVVSPQTVIYIAKTGDNYNLEAQGTSVSQMTNYKINVNTVSGTTDTYTLSTTISGVSASLWAIVKKSGIFDKDGGMAYPSNYIATTNPQSAEAYRQWQIVPISASSDNYVAVKACLKVKDEEDPTKFKYYAPYYASYPFKFVSPGMKAYYVSGITDKKYTLQEITSEVIPGATPVIIECPSNNPSDCKIEPLRGNYGGISGNKLKGVYFCNLEMSPVDYPDCRTEFKAASMRVWAVKNDKLVLTNSTDRTINNTMYSGFSGYWLRPNESYLANVPSTAAADLVSAGKATTISFDTDGGTTVEDISGGEGEPVTAPTAPTKTGYKFTGWNPALPSVFPAEDMTVKAQWEKNKYTITFNTNGGTAIEPITQEYQSPITKPSDPTKEGNTFAGWDATIPDLMPAENLTINALWTTNKYTITFDTDGGTTISPISQDYGTSVTAPANPTKTGYTFVGWDKAVPSTMPAGNVVIKAQWQINQYTITFDTDGGSAIDPITQNYNTAITKPADPTKTGSSFAGWNKDIPSIMPAKNDTIKAQWQINEYSLNYFVDGTLYKSVKYVYNSEVTAEAEPTKVGYTFSGWKEEIPLVMPAKDVTITGTFSVNQYTITFDTDGGTEVAPITQDYNTAIIKPSNPTKDGSVFVGWDKEIPALVPAENMTIKALWNKLYTITFDTDGAGEIAAITAVSGTAITKPEDPKKVGYTFTGWNPALPATMPEGDLTVKATWNINQHKVTFKNYDGSVWSEATLNYNANIILPETNPTKEGAVFSGWSPTPAATMPDEDVVYTATFDDSEYTITFDTDGGSPVPGDIKDYYNRDITDRTKDIQNPTKEGYTFKGWDPTIPSVITGDLTIKAIWEKNKYTITFDTDGGSAVEPIQLEWESNITAPSEPTKTGYTFIGWNPALPKTMPMNDISTMAQWQINKHTITYFVDGKEYKKIEDVEYNTSITPETEPTKEGYSFSGWSTIPSTMPDNDVTITGTFSVNQYTITFDTDGGSEVSSITQDYNTEIAMPISNNPTKEGYTFMGWNPELPEKMPLNGLSVKAQWQINEYSLNYFVDGTLYKSVKYVYNTDVTAEPAPSKVGYTFSGWKEEIPSVMPAKDVTITGTFSVNPYTITFDTDGGTTIAPITQNYNTSIAPPSNPMKEGYTFIGWDKEIPSTMPAENMTIKALWQVNEYSLNYFVDGTLYKSVKYVYNTAVTAEPAAEKIGYTFSGWQEEIPTVMPAKDVTITGTFKINQYTITFDSNGGTEVVSITQDYGTKIKVDAPTKDGYDFAGWDPALPETMPARNMDLKAIWGPKTRKETYDFNEGWTWVSFAMFNDEMKDLGTVLSSLKWTSTDEIKGADVWGIYSVKKNKWVGYLAGFNDVTMYKIHSSVDQQLTLEGSYQNSKGDMSMSVDKGWNYLAYLSLKDLPVAEALQNYAASEGDILKSQTQSATYSNGKWIGDLQMEPRKGYMLYRAADNKVSFTYPIALEEEKSNNSRAMRFESKAQRFSSNMNVFATVEGVMAVPGDSIVAVAVDGVRGGATIDDEGKASLTILGDNNADIYLALMHNNTVVASAKAPINYASDNIVGSYANPTAIEFVEGSEAWSGDYSVTAVYTMDGRQLPTTDIKTLTTGLYIIKYETLSDNNSNTGGCRVIRVVR